MESFNGQRSFEGWNGAPESLLVAAEAAVEAGPFEPAYQSVRLTWDDRLGNYESTEEARTRLRHGPMPTRVEIHVGQLNDPAGIPDISRAHVMLSTLGNAVTLSGTGEEWDKASRAYQAAVVAYERSLPEPDEPEAPIDEPPAAVVAPAARSGVRVWLNENQGILTFVGIVVTVIVAVVTLLLV